MKEVGRRRAYIGENRVKPRVVFGDLRVDRLEQAEPRDVTRKSTLSDNAGLVIVIFIVSLYMPIYFMVGGIKLSPNTAVNVIFFLNMIFIFRTIKFQPADFLVILVASYSALAIIVNHGLSRVPMAGLIFISTFSPYFMARVYIDNHAKFISAVRISAVALVILLPLNLYETYTGHRITLEILSKVFNTIYNIPPESRLGLYRVQSVFDHPILYGLMAASVLGVIITRFNDRSYRSILMCIVIVSAFISLSSAAFLLIVLQIAFAIYARIFSKYDNRWRLFFIFSAVMLVLLEVLSGRGVLKLLAAYLSLNPQTAYYRVLIFEFGMDNIFMNPWFGIGMNDWVRPSWMVTASADNFWLLSTMKYGVPWLMLMSAFIYLCLLKNLKTRILQRGQVYEYYFITMFSFCICIFSVHLWGPMYCWFFFLLGAHACFESAPARSGSPGKPL